MNLSAFALGLAALVPLLCLSGHYAADHSYGWALLCLVLALCDMGALLRMATRSKL
jgi:hypothetical protein